MGYVERHLLPDERVLYKTRLHWILYLKALLVTLVGVVLTGVLTQIPDPPWLWYVGLAIAVAGALWWIVRWIELRTSEFAVTSMRLIFKVGLVARYTTELLLSKVDLGHAGPVRAHAELRRSRRDRHRRRARGVSARARSRRLPQPGAARLGDSPDCVKFDVAILATEPLPDVVRQVQLAERLGYDTAWITDSHLVCRELWVTLGACAAATSRIRLGPGVTVPHSRHVSVTASAIATLHDLAPGRTVIGVGTGGSSAQTMGLSLAEVGKAATLAQTATSLRRLLHGDSARFETGIDGRLAWLEAPRAIPIYLAGSGPKMLETAGRLGDGAIVYATVSPDVLRVAIERVAAGARAAGRSLDDLDVALWAPMSIGRDRERARDHARGRVASACRHPLPVRLSDEDEAAMKRVRESYDAYQHASAASAHRALVSDRLVDLMALAGTPEDVAAQVGRLRAVRGLTRVIAFPQAPGKGFAAREEILTLFADEVVARL